MQKKSRAVAKSSDTFRPQTIVEHLNELRKRILISLASFFGLLLVLAGLPSFNASFGTRLMKLLQEYLLKNINGAEKLNLVFLDPLEPVFTVLKLSALAAFVILAPLFIYQLYAYIKPAFTKKTRSYAGTVIFGAQILFLLGGAFSLYFLIPASFNILISYGMTAGSTPMLSMGKFFDMFVWMFLLFTLPFELPVVIGVLAKAGIVTGKMLSKIRKPAYLALAIFSAAVTPDPTPFSMLILWALLLILFEFGVLLAHLLKKGGN